MKEPLTWLQEWYFEHCNGDWEHREGIKIGTLDNPGWWLQINIADTELEDLSIERVLVERSENDWIAYETKEGKFVGHCGPLGLNELVAVFKKYCDTLDD
jgi:Immunity protein 53